MTTKLIEQASELRRTTPKAYTYLSGRGISEAVADQYVVGYSDNEFSPLYDRLLFPLRDLYGEVQTIQGRALYDYKEARRPKYWHTPYTSGHKGYHLYGLYEAAPRLCQHDAPIIVVEGPVCVLTARMLGLHAVALFGTAFTIEQALLLRRFTNKLVLWYDHDKAGAAALEKAYKITAEAGFADVAGVSSSHGKDLNDTFTRLGTDGVRRVLERYMVW